jgi:hypothetical protein
MALPTHHRRADRAVNPSSGKGTPLSNFACTPTTSVRRTNRVSQAHRRRENTAPMRTRVQSLKSRRSTVNCQSQRITQKRLSSVCTAASLGHRLLLATKCRLFYRRPPSGASSKSLSGACHGCANCARRGRYCKNRELGARSLCTAQMGLFTASDVVACVFGAGFCAEIKARELA